MTEERWGTVAEACTEIEPDGARPQTATEASELWRTAYRTNVPEAIRMRHCCGCQWLKICGKCLYCSYMMDTGDRRPCPPGHGCKVKQTPPGWKYPRGYVAWCKKMDDEYGAKNAKRKKKEDFALIYARQLYGARYHSADIAEIVGIPVLVLRGYAYRGNWKSGDKSRVRSRIGDLSGEKELYKRAKEEWERANKHTEEGSNEDATE